MVSRRCAVQWLSVHCHWTSAARVPFQTDAFPEIRQEGIGPYASALLGVVLVCNQTLHQTYCVDKFRRICFSDVTLITVSVCMCVCMSMCIDVCSSAFNKCSPLLFPSLLPAFLNTLGTILSMTICCQ